MIRVCALSLVVLFAISAPAATVRDFGPASLDYVYPAGSWKLGETVAAVRDGEVGSLQILSTEHGGGGVLLRGSLVPGGEKFLALTARKLEGNAADRLAVQIIRAKGGGKLYVFPIDQLAADRYSTLYLPLEGDGYDSVEQVQFQGTNFSPAARPLKILIDKLETVTEAEARSKQPRAQGKVGSAAGPKIEPDGVPSDPPGDPAETPLLNDKPTVPGWCRWNWRAAWLGMHRGFVERAKRGRADIVFLGDSLTMGWGDRIEGRYAPRTAVNFGIGGDSTRQILWRVRHGTLEGLSPRLVVLMIGTNNLYGDANAGSDEEIAQGVESCVRLIENKLPRAKILLLGLLPRQNDYFCGRVRRINASIAKLDDGKRTRFLDFGARFLGPDEKIKPELYDKDQLHLSPAGYEQWGQAMDPLVRAMLE